MPRAGPLGEAFAAIRLANGHALADGFRAAGADEAIVVDAAPDERTFGQRLRDAAGDLAADGLVVLGSGSIPLARAADLAAFVAAAAGPAGRALANNRFSADVVAIAGTSILAELPDLGADNGLPRWLAESAGYAVGDLGRRWRLQVDLDTPLDVLLVRPGDPIARATAGEPAADGPTAGAPPAAVRRALAGVVAVSRDPGAELIVAGRMSAAGLAWLERSTASRTRALIEERGLRTRSAGQRPAASTLGLLLDRDGPDALGTLLARLGDGALVDSRVLLAHRFGADERLWPAAEDRFASDLLLPDRIADPWLRALTAAALGASIPIVLGGHSLVGPGLRLVFNARRSWT
jgi:CTP:molybdopterin cytidylyltransferase MocA